MSDNIERQNELSKRVLIPGEHKSTEQRTPTRNQLAPAQLIFTFSLGTISGLAVFVLIWTLAGFSKLAIILPFVGGFIGIAIEIIRRKTNA